MIKIIIWIYNFFKYNFFLFQGGGRWPVTPVTTPVSAHADLNWVSLGGLTAWCRLDLKRISEVQLQQQHEGNNVDLEPYLKKLHNVRRRTALVNNVLQNAQVQTMPHYSVLNNTVNP